MPLILKKHDFKLYKTFIRTRMFVETYEYISETMNNNNFDLFRLCSTNNFEMYHVSKQ